MEISFICFVLEYRAALFHYTLLVIRTGSHIATCMVDVHANFIGVLSGLGLYLIGIYGIDIRAIWRQFQFVFEDNWLVCELRSVIVGA